MLGLTFNRLYCVQEKKKILERKRKQLLMTKYMLHDKIYRNCMLHMQSYNTDIVKDIVIVNEKLKVLDDEINKKPD
jgi:hypothetical protein